MNILILGAGVQGTLYGVRLARAGHSVTLIARGKRAAELRTHGALVRNALTGVADAMHLAVVERLAPETHADLCFVFVRREQIEAVLPDLTAATALSRIVVMVDHANGSEALFAALGRHRVVLGFPSAAGSIENGVCVYVDVKPQPTAIERTAPDVAAILHHAGFAVQLITDMDSWLQRHAVFVTAVGGALCQQNCDARMLSRHPALVRTLILAVREGWSQLDRHGVAPPPLSLRAIFCWVPLPLAVAYWCRLFGSTKGDYYFARHTKHALDEIAALIADVRKLVFTPSTPHLDLLYQAIDHRPSPAFR